MSLRYKISIPLIVAVLVLGTASYFLTAGGLEELKRSTLDLMIENKAKEVEQGIEQVSALRSAAHTWSRARRPADSRPLISVCPITPAPIAPTLRPAGTNVAVSLISSLASIRPRASHRTRRPRIRCGASRRAAATE